METVSDATGNGGEDAAGDGGGRWLGDAVSPGDKSFRFYATKTGHFHLPESLRDEDDLIFFLGDAEEGEGLSCLDLFPTFDVDF